VCVVDIHHATVGPHLTDDLVRVGLGGHARPEIDELPMPKSCVIRRLTARCKKPRLAQAARITSGILTTWGGRAAPISQDREQPGVRLRA
jgi:hypothetical protein